MRNITTCLVNNETISNCTHGNNQSVSTYIEYKQALEYVISDISTSFYLYAVVECSSDVITLGKPFLGSEIKRSSVGNLAVVIDLAIVLMFITTLWATSYLVKVDAERHKKLLYETSEFSITVGNLPRLSPTY